MFEQRVAGFSAEIFSRRVGQGVSKDPLEPCHELGFVCPFEPGDPAMGFQTGLLHDVRCVDRHLQPPTDLDPRQNAEQIAVPRQDFSERFVVPLTGGIDQIRKAVRHHVHPNRLNPNRQPPLLRAPSAVTRDHHR